MTVLGTEGNFYKVKVTVNGREVTAYVSTSYVSIGGSSDTTDDNKDNIKIVCQKECLLKI